MCKDQGRFPFPTEDELKCPLANGIFVTQMSYKVGTNRLIKLVREVLGLENEENRMYSNAIAATTSYQDSTMENGSTSNTVTSAIGIMDAATIPTATKKNRESGPIEFDEIFQVAKTKNSHEKLDLILNLASKMERLLHSDVTERIRLFDVKFIKSIILCFLNHCDGNRETFQSLHPQFLHSKFSKGCGCSKG